MPEDKKNTQDTNTPDVSKKEEKQEEVSFTEEQQEKVNELISSRLDRAEEKWKEKLVKLQEEAEQRVAKAKEEGEKLASLSAEEREKEVLEKQRVENEERERKLFRRENKLEAIALFSEAGVPIDLVDYVVDEDREKTLENAKKFIENYQGSLEKSVAKKLEGQPPKDVDNKKVAPKTGLKPAY